MLLSVFGCAKPAETPMGEAPEQTAKQWIQEQIEKNTLFSFSYDDTPYEEHIRKWNKTVEETESGWTVTYKKDGVVAWSEITFDEESAALEWTNYFKNEGSTDSPVIQDMMTAPLEGMAHGSYTFISPPDNKDVFERFNNSKCTAYSEFGVPSLSPTDRLRCVIPADEIFPMRETDAWVAHHGYRAFIGDTWTCNSLYDHYFGKASTLEERVDQSNWIQSVGYQATIEQKLGHVFCVRGFNHPDDLTFTLEMIQKQALGVVQVPFTDLSVVKAVREAADYPLVIINDTEQGWPPSKLPKTQLMSLGACDDDEALRVYVRAVVSESQKAGLNATWGQIADICRGDAPCSVYRKLSDDPHKVARQLEVLYTEMLKHHFMPCAKHYPGSSEDPMDTHMAEGLSYLTEQELMDFDLIPYKHLLSKNLLPTIMVNHTKYVNIDPDYPASLSKKVIDIIRRMGFDGVCYTDSFAMMGILQKFGEENVYGMAIAAGNDVVLPNFRNPMRQCFEMLKKNYEDGMISEDRLNEAVRRVLAAQEFVAQQDGICPFSEADREKLEGIAADCITAVTDGVDAAIEKKPTFFAVLTENGYDPSDDNHEIQTGQWYDPNRVAQAIKREFPDAHIEFMSEFSNQRDHNRVLTAATKYEQAVFVTFCTTTSYLGTDGLTRRTESVIEALSRSGKVAAIVHFGNPFALKNLPPQKRRIYGYMMEMSQDYAIEVLSGKRKAKGKLPFVIE